MKLHGELSGPSEGDHNSYASFTGFCNSSGAGLGEGGGGGVGSTRNLHVENP